VFDSAGSRLVFKQKYLEWSTRLHPNTTLYGFGEQQISARGCLASRSQQHCLRMLRTAGSPEQ
jgi:hypothetical protein